MLIETAAVFEGPSLHAAYPAVSMRIRTEPPDDTDAVGVAALAAALEQLRALDVDSAAMAREIVDRVEREDGASGPGLIAAELALALQRHTGAVVARSTIFRDPAARMVNLAFEFEYGDVALLAGQLAVALVNLAITGAPEARAQARQLQASFAEPAEEIRADRWNLAVARALKARDLPVRRVHKHLDICGQGRFRRFLDSTITGNTGSLASWIANDKMLSNRILRDLGVPMTEQVPVATAEEAVRAAARIGYPVVLKPRGGSNGRLVFVGLRDAAKVEAAFAEIARHRFRTLLERMVVGTDHRILMVDGEMVAAAKRIPGHVIGDGRRSVEALMDEVNADPRRGPGSGTPLSLLKLDDEAAWTLERQGLGRDSVPAPGQVVYLRGTANVSQGATSIDVTDTVHPDNREMAVRVAAACGVDVLGIDFITPDIACSYHEVGGAICEVNASPALRLHQTPAEGRPRDVVSAIANSLYPPGAPARVRSAAILGADRAPALLLAHILKLAGHRVGVALHGEIYIDGPQRLAEAAPPPRIAAMVLGDAVIDAAVMLFTPEDLARHGLGFDGATVGAVLGEAGDTLARAARRILADGTREVLAVEGRPADAAVLAARLGPGRRAVSVVASARSVAAALARAMGVAAEQVRLGLATVSPAFAERPGGFRVLRPAGWPAILVDRLAGNPAIEHVCALAAAMADGRPGRAVIDGAADADRVSAAALLRRVVPAAFTEVVLVGGYDPPVEDDGRSAIARAIGGSDEPPGVVLILSDNPERAIRFVDYATGGAWPHL